MYPFSARHCGSALDRVLLASSERCENLTCPPRDRCDPFQLSQSAQGVTYNELERYFSTPNPTPRYGDLNAVRARGLCGTSEKHSRFGTIRSYQNL